MAESSLFDEFEFLSDARENPESLLGWCKQNGERGQLVMKEWDTEKNVNVVGLPIAIEDVFFQDSTIKRWWNCSKCGRSFPMSVWSRTMQGQGCCVCGHIQAGLKRMDMALENGNDLESWCRANGERGKRLLREWDEEANLAEFGKSRAGGQHY